MKRRGLLLLEVVVGLALLALLGVWLVRLQAASLRQHRDARLRDQVVQQVEQMLWEWSSSGVPVTLPSTGRMSDTLEWRREVQPMRVTAGLIATQITLTVTETTPHAPQKEIYRVGWLVPRKLKAEKKS
jgi:hypothetical protein